MKCLLALGWMICGATAAFAQASVPPVTTKKAVSLDVSKLKYPVLMQPSFEKAASSELAVGTKKTVFTPLKAKAASDKLTGDVKGAAPMPLEPMSKEEFIKLGIGMDAWLERAGREMDAVMRQLRPDFEKVKPGEKPSYAVLEWDHPLAPSLIFAPAFAEIFRREIGASLLISIPDQSHIYVFAGDGLKMNEFLESLQLTFKNSSASVSSEIFLIRKDDIRPRVIGTFAPGDD